MIAVTADMKIATLPSTPVVIPPVVVTPVVVPPAGGHLLLSLLVALGLGCGDQGEPYQPKQPPAGVKANLPAVPSVTKSPIKDGEAYTVWGASYYLRSRVHHNDVAGKDLKITGYIVATNIAEAPKCAIHATGKEDPTDCQAPIPTFWLADTKDAKPEDSIKVEGWASNFAQLYDAVNEYRKRRAKKKSIHHRAPSCLPVRHLPFLSTHASISSAKPDARAKSVGQCDIPATFGAPELFENTRTTACHPDGCGNKIDCLVVRRASW